MQRSGRQRLFRDPIIATTQTAYQDVVVTARDHVNGPRDVRLHLNGRLQFSSVDEYRYHEALVHPALSRLPLMLAIGGLLSLVVGAGLLLTAPEASSSAAVGAKGSIDVADTPYAGNPRNDPKVSCVVTVRFFDFAAGTQVSSVVFERPGEGTPLLTGGPFALGAPSGRSLKSPAAIKGSPSPGPTLATALAAAERAWSCAVDSTPNSASCRATDSWCCRHMRSAWYSATSLSASGIWSVLLTP